MGSLRHLGFIMDGNRRWATQRGLPAVKGHEAGYQRIKGLLKALRQSDVEYVTIYSFSTENWSRSKKEIEGLFKLMKWVLKNEVQEIVDDGVRVRVIGQREGLPADLVALIDNVEEQSKGGTRTLCVCLNYGGQQEIVDAANATIESGQELTIESLQDHVYAPDVPPCDLIVRTSGEMRLSNFMLWRAAYSELAFTDTLWPDFSDDEMFEVIDEFNNRQRRFGGSDTNTVE